MTSCICFHSICKFDDITISDISALQFRGHLAILLIAFLVCSDFGSVFTIGLIQKCISSLFCNFSLRCSRSFNLTRTYYRVCQIWQNYMVVAFTCAIPYLVALISLTLAGIYLFIYLLDRK